MSSFKTTSLVALAGLGLAAQGEALQVNRWRRALSRMRGVSASAGGVASAYAPIEAEGGNQHGNQHGACRHSRNRLAGPRQRLPPPGANRVRCGPTHAHKTRRSMREVSTESLAVTTLLKTKRHANTGCERYTPNLGSSHIGHEVNK